MAIAAVTIFILFFTLFLYAQIIKNNSIVDIFWGFGYVLTAWVLFFIQGEYSITQIIMNIMVSLWGLRLFYHIAKRNVGKEEDFRYKEWRKAWGKYVVPRAFIQVFMLQGFFMFVIGSTVNYVNTSSLGFVWYSLAGVDLFLAGYFFQVLGDLQLKRHIENSNGLLTTGLWSITRHPNYFGESVMWFGMFLFGFLNGMPWYYVISPLTITIILRFISVPLLEEKMSKREGWEQYAKRVNIMFPWVKKNDN